MKKLIVLITAMLALSLSLVGCTSQAQQTEKTIDEIGEVTLDSQQAIDEAQEKYDSLSDEEKGKVANYPTLEDAQKTYVGLLQKDLNDQIEKATTLANGSFAEFYGTDSLTAFNNALEKAKSIATSEDKNALNEALESLKSEIDSFSQFIDSLKSDSRSKQTNEGDYPYSVDQNKLQSGFIMTPLTKRDSSYPYNVCFDEGETTDSPLILGFQMGDKWCHYSCELANIPTTVIEVQDKNGNLQKALVNTEVKIISANTKYGKTDTGLYPLGEHSIYLFCDKNKGITLALADLVTKNGFITFSWSF